MLEITSHRNGEVLNHNDGFENKKYLKIDFTGITDPQSLVKVNGLPVERKDRIFNTKLKLDRKTNKIKVTAVNKFGEFSQNITLVWDKASFKRYTMRIDDNIFFLTDISRDKPASIFEHFYLKKLKEIHDNYGTKFILIF